ncbi:MAG: sulfatase-like hydrolase/transferase [Planctomycetaceae bacterium]|nr:sulfatase-like hydrolase/transferase [Planctomycetaceae bacterium]
MNAVCLVIDRLHAGYVGAYGNTWIETPSLDRLASESLLLDQAMIDSPDLQRLYRSYWQGWHALCPELPPASRPSLPAMLRQAGVATALLTDEPLVARHPLAEDFEELIEIDRPWQAKTAAEIEQTHFGRCFVEMIEWLQAARGPFLLWCHLGGLGAAWDAPLEFREAYREPGDPPPPESADVPDLMLPPDPDPDELLGISQAYAGQVTLFDACFGAFRDFLDGLPGGDETLLTLCSARGFPLGEHGRVGPCDNAPFGDLLQVPWMIRMPDCRDAAVRSSALVEPADLWATLLDYWSIGNRPDSPTGTGLLRLADSNGPLLRDRVCMLGSSGRAIRTPAWFLRTGEPPELYAKPDDRWEVNDVASLCPDVVEGLQDALTQYEAALPAGRVHELPPLADMLVRGLE